MIAKIVKTAAVASLVLGAMASLMGAAQADLRCRPCTYPISLNSSSEVGNADSTAAKISADGRFVAFQSRASNLVSGDTNAVSDIFVRDRESNTTTRVSVNALGDQGNGPSVSPAISADGRYVAFHSSASNIANVDTNGVSDVFVYDRQTGATTRVSVSSGAGQANGASFTPAISADGRYVAFQSSATNLVSGDTNGVADVFLRDRQAGTTARILVIQANGPSLSPAISADGRYVAFQSSATNLVSGDTNGVSDIFLRDRQAGITRRVSTTSSGTQGNRASYAPSISADGERVAFASHATNLVAYDTNDKADVFVQWQHPAITGRVSLRSDRQEANGHSQSPAISADGRYVAFESSATNLDPKDEDLLWDVYTVDLQTRETDLASEASRKKSWYGWDTYFEGDKGNGSSRAPAISADGRSVAFESAATNLWNLWDPWEWSGDTNGVLDVSVQDRW